MDLSQSKYGKRLREVMRYCGGLCLRGDDAPDGEEISPCVGVSRQSLEGSFSETQLPVLEILGNSHSYARIAYSRRRQMLVNICLLNDLPGRHQLPVAGCGEAPYVCSVSFREEFFSETGRTVGSNPPHTYSGG